MDAINDFARQHPDATFWVAVSLSLVAVWCLTRLDRRPRYAWPSMRELRRRERREAKLTSYLQDHEPTPQPGPGTLKMGGVKVCMCGRLVHRRAKSCPHGRRVSRSG